MLGDFFLVSTKEEVDSPEIPCVNPVNLNDFFDGDGKIYGYQDLQVTRLYTALMKISGFVVVLF